MRPPGVGTCRSACPSPPRSQSGSARPAATASLRTRRRSAGSAAIRSNGRIERVRGRAAGSAVGRVDVWGRAAPVRRPVRCALTLQGRRYPLERASQLLCREAVRQLCTGERTTEAQTESGRRRTFAQRAHPACHRRVQRRPLHRARRKRRSRGGARWAILLRGPSSQSRGTRFAFGHPRNQTFPSSLECVIGLTRPPQRRKAPRRQVKSRQRVDLTS